jgi:hypothetical protein
MASHYQTFSPGRSMDIKLTRALSVEVDQDVARAGGGKRSGFDAYRIFFRKAGATFCGNAFGPKPRRGPLPPPATGDDLDERSFQAFHRTDGSGGYPVERVVATTLEAALGDLSETSFSVTIEDLVRSAESLSAPHGIGRRRP